MVEPGRGWLQALGDAIACAMLENSCSTAKVYVRSAEIAAALEPLGKALGLVFEPKKRLQAILCARKGLAAATRGGGFGA